MSTIRKQKLAVLGALGLAILFFIFWQTYANMPSELEYRQQAQERANRQDWNALEELAKHWAEHYPNSGMMHAARADVFRMRGQYSAAADEYSKALSIEKDHPQLLAYLGISLLETGNYQQAKETCRKSTNLAAHLPDGWYCLSLASAELDDAQTLHTALAELQRLYPESYQTAERVIRTHICIKKSAEPDWCR